MKECAASPICRMRAPCECQQGLGLRQSSGQWMMWSEGVARTSALMAGDQPGLVSSMMRITSSLLTVLRQDSRVDCSPGSCTIVSVRSQNSAGRFDGRSSSGPKRWYRSPLVGRRTSVPCSACAGCRSVSMSAWLGLVGSTRTL